MIGGLLNRTLQVWRRTTGRDSGGGQATTWIQVGTVAARRSQPTSAQIATAQRAQAQLTDVIYTEPDADVQRGDELRDPDSGECLRVEATFTPSEPVYLRADCHSRQAEESG